MNFGKNSSKGFKRFLISKEKHKIGEIIKINNKKDIFIIFYKVYLVK